ncbi:hypothetical protein K435DRAFT_959876 [Dendrothele bispora CBS 962.96]|uniref:Uncharacterized protein n=1 Tax=Dendrothele bispora (strain CBS 962.96) TaxID=1314807 RepID=A0A4S8MVG2_DENBC|nr:hypothetical protein K435DRAFT_959876 [Dendrothele bispora CBS 962.96]
MTPSRSGTPKSELSIAPLEAVASRKSYGAASNSGRRSVLSKRLGYAHLYPHQSSGLPDPKKASRKRFWRYTLLRLMLVLLWLFFGLVVRGIAERWDLDARKRLYLGTGITFLLLIGMVILSVQWATEIREEHRKSLIVELDAEIYRLEGMYDFSQRVDHVSSPEVFDGQVSFVDPIEGSKTFNALEARYLEFYYLKYNDFQLQGRQNRDLRNRLDDLSRGLRALDVIEEHAESARRRNDILDFTFMGDTGRGFLDAFVRQSTSVE